VGKIVCKPLKINQLWKLNFRGTESGKDGPEGCFELAKSAWWNIKGFFRMT
jgi:hypothetical protein